MSHKIISLTIPAMSDVRNEFERIYQRVPQGNVKNTCVGKCLTMYLPQRSAEELQAIYLREFNNNRSAEILLPQAVQDQLGLVENKLLDQPNVDLAKRFEAVSNLPDDNDYVVYLRGDRERHAFWISPKEQTIFDGSAGKVKLSSKENFQQWLEYLLYFREFATEEKNVRIQVASYVNSNAS